MKTILLAAGIIVATQAGAETPVLVVDVPESFASQWGPGPAIEAAYEAVCGCDLHYRAGDVLPRLMLEGTNSAADVIMGLSTDEMGRARALGVLTPHTQDTTALTLPFAWIDPVFLPYSWGHTAFIYDTTRLATPPTSFADLLTLPDDVKIVIQDPRTSPSGLALVLWVKAVYGDNAAAYWVSLAPHLLTVTQTWAEAYGLFTTGEADMVLSYTTSPAYHMIVESDFTKVAAIFPEGHYFNAELAAVMASSAHPELAHDFMAFILSDTFQEMMPRVNFGLPVTHLPADKMPAAFATLPLPDKVLFLTDVQVDAMRDAAIAEWVTALSQ
jgi:thiamine transport system substrate-binding protein